MENEAGTLCSFIKTLHEVKASGLHLSFSAFQ